MTEPTPVPDVAGGGSRTATVTSPSAAHVGTSSEAHDSAAHAPTGTNGHHAEGEAAPDAHADEVCPHNGYAVTASAGRPAHPASESRTADDVEAGIIALWHTYGQSHQQVLRDRLVLHYAPLVKYVAGRVGTGLPAHVDVADLIQSGIFGLVDAIEKFEPERGLKFETYAMQRIRGAILDDLRSQDWVPRSVRSRARDVERALERLGASLQRTPTDRELAVELKIGLAELRELYAQLQLTSVVALDELIAAGRTVGGAGASLAESLPDEGAEDPIATLVDQDSRRQLADAIAQLAERDRVVVTLYYFENLTLAEIGKVLGVTESRVCQLHTRAVLRLRTKLNEQLEA
ncbi:FliA/WhiG family RNA polymerase sigma factor [Actinosynnema sp. CS-041913]|uniref:FliA/WhiG family RNA polymerase sigma factor n=1 Tax=Actinosynnema sp. CS-041913 TaxID=3239917 RepID=UPI003D8D9E88